MLEDIKAIDRKARRIAGRRRLWREKVGYSRSHDHRCSDYGYDDPARQQYMQDAGIALPHRLEAALEAGEQAAEPAALSAFAVALAFQKKPDRYRRQSS